MLLVSRCSPFSFSGEVYLKSGVISSFSCKSQWGEHINVLPSFQAAGIKPDRQCSQFLPPCCCMCTHMCTHTCVTVCMARSGLGSRPPLLSHPGDWAQVIKRGGKHPYLLSHCFSPLHALLWLVLDRLPHLSASLLSHLYPLEKKTPYGLWSVTICAELLASLWAIQC